MKEITFEEGLEIARQEGMDWEYLKNIKEGDTPYEALRDWDII